MRSVLKTETRKPALQQPSKLARLAWMRNLYNLQALRQEALVRLHNPYDPINWRVCLSQAQFYRDKAATCRQEAEAAGWTLP